MKTSGILGMEIMRRIGTARIILRVIRVKTPRTLKTSKTPKIPKTSKTSKMMGKQVEEAKKIKAGRVKLPG